jgi:hypothetical protein
MAEDKLHSAIVEFLNARDEGEDPVVADKNSDFARAITALWAEEKLDHDKLKAHFTKLDETYKTRVLDIRTKHDVFDDEKVTYLMKAALDDIQEHKPDELFGGNTSIVPDDVIRAFLAESDDPVIEDE